MSLRYGDSRGNRDVLRIPVIRMAFALSLLIHAAVLWPWMPSRRVIMPGEEEHKEVPTRFQVRIAPNDIPEPPPPAAAQSRPAPPRPLRAPAPAPHRPPSSPAPVIALDAPGRALPPPAAPIANAPAPVRSPVVGDLAALVEARRKSRGETAPPAPPTPQVGEDENARRARIVAENLGSGRAPAFGDESRNSGGVFQVEHVYFDYAEFTFYGWNRDIRRNSRQLIEVRKGNTSDIRIAVVRRMIAIIREYEQEDFRWDSTQLRRSVTLSARLRDSAGLEEFLMREFFPDFAKAR